MARTSIPAAPHAARSAADAATTPGPRARCPGGGPQPGSGRPGRAVGRARRGAAVAVIAARAGISTAAARQALLAHEKAGTATQVKGSRPDIADTWMPAAPAAPPAEALDSDSTPGDGQPAAELADASQPALAPAGDTTEAGKALAAGNLDAAMTALETARDLAAQARRAVKAAASGRRAPATRPGALRDLVEDHLRKFPGTAFTPHQVGKVLTRSAGRSPTPSTSSSSSVSRKWSPTSPAPTSSPPPPPPRTRRRPPAPARRLRPAPRNARPARTARPGQQPMPPRAVPSARVPAVARARPAYGAAGRNPFPPRRPSASSAQVHKGADRRRLPPGTPQVNER
jgi:hypothetical protein